MRLWSGDQGDPWISKGPEFESAPRQISTARSHQGFHILSPSNGLPFVVGWSRSFVDSQGVQVRIRTTLDFHRVWLPGLIFSLRRMVFFFQIQII